MLRQKQCYLKRKKQLSGISMWLSAIKLAVSAGSKIYANKQKTKMAMSDAQLMHAERVWPEVMKLTRANC